MRVQLEHRNKPCQGARTVENLINEGDNRFTITTVSTFLHSRFFLITKTTRNHVSKPTPSLAPYSPRFLPPLSSSSKKRRQRRLNFLVVLCNNLCIFLKIMSFSSLKTLHTQVKLCCPNMTSPPGFKPWPHYWEANARRHCATLLSKSMIAELLVIMMNFEQLIFAPRKAVARQMTVVHSSGITF